MPKLVGTIGSRPEKYAYRDIKLERDGYLKVYSYEVQGFPHRQEMMDRGDAVVVLPIDEIRRVLYLIRQPRFLKPLVELEDGRAFVASGGPGLHPYTTLDIPSEMAELYECPAGMIDEDESPEEAAVRELREETGLVVAPDQLKKIGVHHPSIGASTERLTLFIAELRDPIQRVEPRGDGSEQISIWEVTYREAFDLLDAGEIEGLSAAALLGRIKIRDLERRLDHRC